MTQKRDSKIILIAGLARNNVIGNQNQLPWHIKEDLKRFKELTFGHPVIMGRKTYESILETLGKPLPGRKNIVLTNQQGYFHQDSTIVHSIQEAIEKAQESSEKIFIIGGQTVYQQFLPIADKLEITHIHKNFEGDAKFPEISSKEWLETKSKDYQGENLDFTFSTYERKNQESKNKSSLNELTKSVMEMAEDKGFGTKQEEINVPEKLALIHSEISEAYEAYRKKNIDGKHGFKEELGDAIQRIIHLGGIFNMDLEKEITKKIEINKERNWKWKELNETQTSNKEIKKGMFITFEGIDGCGKSTQIRELTKHIFEKDKHNHIILTRNPYKNTNIRKILTQDTDPNSQSEKLADLYITDRINQTNELIIPNLEKGHIVISDRYKISTIVYQSAQGLDMQSLIDKQSSLPVPDMTFVIDISPEEAQLRMKKEPVEIRGKEHKFEANLEFIHKLRKNIFKSKELLSEKIFIIDGFRSIEEITQEICQIFDKEFAKF